MSSTKTAAAKKWFKPVFDFDDSPPDELSKAENNNGKQDPVLNKSQEKPKKSTNTITNVNDKNWLKKFDPSTVEDLAVHKKKLEEIEQWINSACDSCNSNMLLLTGPVGSGKTITVQTIANKYRIKITEWITPIDVDIPRDNGEFEFRQRQSAVFLEFLINAANFTSLLDNNDKKLVLVEDYPNTFLKSPNEFTEVLMQYKHRAKSPIVFICSDSNTDKNSVVNLFTPTLKDQCNIHHIGVNSVSITSMKSALKRVSEIISSKYSAVYNTPSSDLIECVSNSSAGDVRSAVLNLHFASLKGSNKSLETSIYVGKESKNKTRKRKQVSSKFTCIGKDQTVSILHGVGRVLNPKVSEDTGKLTHEPLDVIEQFTSQPTAFVNFLQENYLSHYSNIDHAEKAAEALSFSDYVLNEWRESICQEYGIYIAAAGLMLSNKAPVLTWNPVRGPKNMRITYPTLSEIPLLEPNNMYKGKVLVSDYKTYCNIINNHKYLI